MSTKRRRFQYKIYMIINSIRSDGEMNNRQTDMFYKIPSPTLAYTR